MNRYLCIYGGIDISPKLQAFVEVLTRTILDQLDVTLVTGGYLHPPGVEEQVSVDRVVIGSAERFLAERGRPLESRLETWLPGGEDRKDAVRFRERAVRVMAGRSVQARRFELVAGTDALVTVMGEVKTRMMLDLALAIGRPALPLPFTGGDSRDAWGEKETRAQVMDWFGISEEQAARLERVDLEDLPAEGMEELAREIVALLPRGIRRRCLVLMDFDPEPTRFYDEVVRPALESEGFHPIRIDREAYTGHVRGIFLERLADSDCIIADVTEGNPNVMYELGYAHSRGMSPFLFSRGGDAATVRPGLPFYLQEQMLASADAGTDAGRKALDGAIRAFLKEVGRVRLVAPGTPAGTRPPTTEAS